MRASKFLLLVIPAMVCAQPASQLDVPEALGIYNAPNQTGMSIDVSNDLPRQFSSLGVYWEGTQTCGVFTDTNVPGTDIPLIGWFRVNLFDPAGPIWTCTFTCCDPYVEELGDGDMRAAILFTSDTGTSLGFLEDGPVDMEIIYFPANLTETQTLVTEPTMNITDFKFDLNGGTVDADSETWGSVKALFK